MGRETTPYGSVAKERGDEHEGDECEAFGLGEWNELQRKRKISGENGDNVQSEDGAKISTITLFLIVFPIGLVAIPRTQFLPTPYGLRHVINIKFKTKHYFLLYVCLL